MLQLHTHPPFFENDDATAQRFICLLGAHSMSEMGVDYCLLHPFLS